MSVTAPPGLALDDARKPLLASLADIVNARNLLTGDAETRRYRTGYRFGTGRVLAVVRPGTLVEQWRVLVACAASRAIVITQASNTGLTGGSTPDGDDYDRDVVIVSTTRIKRVHLLKDGKQVVCRAAKLASDRSRRWATHDEITE
jgi:D-lactate dehydrogenase